MECSYLERSACDWKDAVEYIVGEETVRMGNEWK
jgi:hypothetical protein